jgi:hypothetical protein
MRNILGFLGEGLAGTPAGADAGPAHAGRIEADEELLDS